MSIKEKPKYVSSASTRIKPENRQYVEFISDGFNTKENRDFISIVSHNIRNPICAVSGYSELLIEDLPGMVKDDLVTYLTQIKHNSDITFQYINKFFEWMYYKTGKIRLEHSYHNLFCLVEESLKAILNNYEIDHNISLNIDPAMEVFVDKNSVLKIFYYLIENALLFTHQNGEISINAKLQNSIAIIEIVDSGIGMTDDLIRVLFDKTENVKLFKNKMHNGTGLSLILVDEYIKLNKGSLSIVSKVNEGTKVSVRLPY